MMPAIVAKMSVWQSVSAVVVPDGSLAGHLAMNGTRCPPSQRSRLTPRRPPRESWFERMMRS